MTNIVAAIAQAAPILAINWTLVLSVITICLTAMATIIKIFSNKVKDEDLRESGYLKSLETKVNENSKKIDDIKDEMKDQMSERKTQIAKMEVETINNTKSLENLKIDNREIVQRLDDLLKQLLEWISGSDN